MNILFRLFQKSLNPNNAPVFLFIALGWLLIFVTATQGMEPNSGRWLPIDLVSHNSADYSVDAPNFPRLAQVNPKIIEAVKQDIQIVAIAEFPDPASPIAEVIEPKPTAPFPPLPSPTPGVNDDHLLVSAGGPYSGEEGSPIALTAAGFNSVIGLVAELVTYEWDLDEDGQFDDADGIATEKIFYDEGEYLVSVQATDLLGRSAIDSSVVTISNVPPLVNIGPDQFVGEGEEVAFLAEVTDPGNDILFYEWDFGDGAEGKFGSTEPSHVYHDDGDYVVRLRVTDNDGGMTEDSLLVRVANQRPEVDAGPDRETDEGELLTLRGTASDPAGDQDTLTYHWDFDFDGRTFRADASGPTVSSVYEAGPAEIVAALLVEDEDGGRTLDTVKVTVNNVAPTIVTVGHDGPVGEGEPLTLNVVASDVGNDTLTFAFDWNNDGTFVRQPASASNIWPDEGEHTIGIRVNDGDGGLAYTTTVASSYNLTPTAIAQGPDSVQVEGTELTFSASDSNDPGADELSFFWNFGDGQTGSDVDVTHIYTDNGVYSATLIVTDDSGAADTDSLAVTIVNASPLADAGSDLLVDEGLGITILFAEGVATDPGSDLLSYAWDFDYDGTTFNEDAVGQTVSWANLNVDGPQEFLVALRVRDDDYPYPTAGGGEIGENIDVLKVSIKNVPPQNVDAGGTYRGIEKQFVLLSASEAQDIPDDALTYAWDLDYNGLTFDVDASGRTISNTWNEAGLYNVGLRVTDDDGAATIDEAAVDVSNAPPTAEAGGPYETTVNQPVVLSGAGSSDPTNDSLTYLWNFGDGTPLVSTSGVTVTHVYLDDAVYAVTLRVDDGRGGADTDTVSVAVNNLPPTAVANADPLVAPEGSVVSFGGSGSSDPGLVDTLTYQWTFGDGSPATNGMTVTHVFADDGVYSATLTVRDDAGAADSATVGVTILNANPVANAGSDRVASEGIQIALTATASDPGVADQLSYAWDFNYDGATFSEDASGATVNVAYLDGPATVIAAVRVRDDDYPFPGGQGGEIGEDIDTLVITINNVPPIAAAGGPYRGVIGQPVILSGAAADVSVDSMTYEWDVDYDGFSFVPDLNGQTVVKIWNIAGNHTIALRATDDDGASDIDTALVDINTMPTADAGGPYVGNEGSSFTLIGSGFDPDGDPLSYAWDLNNDGFFETSGQAINNLWTDNGTYPVALRVDDGRGGQAVSAASVTVNNVAPQAQAGPDVVSLEGSLVTFDGGGSSDAGASDSLTFAWDFGDGTPVVNGINVTHVYADNNVYKVTLTVTDDDGGIGTDDVQVTIHNANPIAVAGADQLVSEGVVVIFDGSGSGDPGSSDTLVSYEWDFDYDGLTFNVDASGQSVTTVYPDGLASYVVALRVRDDDFPYPSGVGGQPGEALDTLSVTVTNQPPTANAGGPYNTTAGSPLTLSGSGIDVAADTLTYAWDLDNNGTFETVGQAIVHTWAVSGTYPVTLLVADDDGEQSTDSTTVQVNSLLPLVWLGWPLLRKKRRRFSRCSALVLQRCNDGTTDKNLF